MHLGEGGAVAHAYDPTVGRERALGSVHICSTIRKNHLGLPYHLLGCICVHLEII